MYSNIRSWSYWRNLALCFMLFSFVGHWLEILVFLTAGLLLQHEPYQGILNNFIEPYIVYGFGAAACILFVQPLAKKLGHNLPVLFLICTLTCAVVEYLAALTVTLRLGSNPFWDYSSMPFNLDGHICLSNSLLLGVTALFFVKVVHPFLDRQLGKFTTLALNITALALLVIFVTCALIYWR